MRPARSVPVCLRRRCRRGDHLPDGDPRGYPAAVRRLSIIKTPLEGRSAIYLAFPFQGRLAEVCVRASAKSPSLARSRHADEDTLGEGLVLDRPRNPEPADAEGEDCKRTIFRDVTARLALQPGGETSDDRFEACLDRVRRPARPRIPRAAEGTRPRS